MFKDNRTREASLENQKIQIIEIWIIRFPINCRQFLKIILKKCFVVFFFYSVQTNSFLFGYLSVKMEWNLSTRHEISNLNKQVDHYWPKCIFHCQLKFNFWHPSLCFSTVAHQMATLNNFSLEPWHFYKLSLQIMFVLTWSHKFVNKNQSQPMHSWCFTEN